MTVDRAADANGGTWDYQTRKTIGGSHASELPTGLGNNMVVVNGKPVACFSSAIGIEFTRATDADGATWTLPILPTGLAGDGKDFHTSMAVVNGSPAICWYAATPPNTALLYMRATNASATAWSTVFIENGNFGSTSLAVVSGNPAICFIDRSANQIKFLRSNDMNGSSWPGSGTTVVSGVNYEDITLLVINSRPAVAFRDPDSRDLKYVRALDGFGTAWGAAQTLDSAGDVGAALSMAIINGNPAISYVDATNNSLKYVRARDIDGGVWGIPVQLEPKLSGALGYHTSLAAINGAPAICYVAADGVGYIRHADPDTHFKINWIAIPP